MYEDIITLMIVLLPAVIAWAVPKLRKRNGNWLISLKIVPLGIIVLFMVDIIINGIYRWRCEYHLTNVANLSSGIRTAIILGSALLTVILAGFLINRKYRAEKKFNPLPSILLFFPSLIAVSILNFFISLAVFNFNDHQDEWHCVYLPRENGDGLVFEQQSIHPFLAEYNYRLRFVRDRESTYQQLFVNCGGRTHFNLYRLKDGRILFRDKDWDYIVDRVKQQAFRLEHLDDHLYMAQVPDENIDSWSGPYEKDGKIVMDMGKHTVPAEDVTGILDGMEYYGCITYRFFYSSSEKAEHKITKTWERQ